MSNDGLPMLLIDRSEKIGMIVENMHINGHNSDLAKISNWGSNKR